MENIRLKFDTTFERLGRLVYRNSVKTLLVILFLCGGLFSQIPKFAADFDDDSFFHSGDPTLKMLNEFKDQFGGEAVIVVALNPREIFDRKFLATFKELHESLEEAVPYLDDIASLVNARYTYGKENELIVEDLLEEIPETAAMMTLLKNRVLSSKLYPNLYISEDGSFTVIMLKLDAYSQKREDEEAPVKLTEPEIYEAIAVVRKTIEPYQQPDVPIFVTGGPVIGEFFEKNILREQGQFMGLAFIAFTILLFLLFRRISGVLIPLLVVVLGLLSTCSFMAVFGAPFSHPTAVLPIFLLAVGIGDSVHILAIFFRQFENGTDKEQAIAFALRHSGLPVLMTSLTTAAGLFSFAAADMLPVANLGIFGGLGVILAWFFTVSLIPALVSLLPLKLKTIETGKGQDQRIDRILIAIAEFSVKRSKSIIGVSILLIVFMAMGLTKQRFSHNVNEWLPFDSEFREGLGIIDGKLKGMSHLEVIIDTGRENGLFEPEVLRAIDRLSNYSQTLAKENGVPIVGKTTSLVDVLKETHQALHGNDETYYKIPEERSLIAQELLLFENSGSDDMRSLVDSLLSKARLSIKVREDDAATYMHFVREIENEAKRLFGDDIKVTVTGSTKIFAQIMHMIMVTMAESYIIAFVVITFLMIFFLSSFKFGILSILPNILPIIMTLGLMGWMNIPLDMSNMLIGTVAIGLAVDDTIHFLHNFRKYHAESNKVSDAVQRTMLTSGRAMVVTTVVLVTGFFLYTLSVFPPLSTLGLALGATLLTALLADILLVPAIMTVMSK